MKKIYLSGLTLFGLSALSAQLLPSNLVTECATENLMKNEFSNNKLLETEINAFNLELSNLQKSGKLSKLYKINSDQVYEIPIVVHVLSKGDAIGTVDNPDDQQIIDWINYTNDVFSGKGNNMLDDTNGGAVIPVKFVLAKVNPKGEITNGINRIDMSSNAQFVQQGLNGSANYPGYHDLNVIKNYGWETTKYYNIYVAHRVASGNVIANGYANYPSANLGNDRSVMMASVSKVGQQTLAHEFGHGLGLRHTHEGYTAGEGVLRRNANGAYERDSNGDYIIDISKLAICSPNNNCSLEGDLVCDTEPIISLYDTSVNLYRCLSDKINQCTDTNFQGGEQNIMSYTHCFRNRFTPGQKNRAIAHLLNYRQGTVNSTVASKGPFNNDVNVGAAYCTPSGISNSGNYIIGIANVKFGEIDNWTNPYNTYESKFYSNYVGSYTLAKTTTTLPVNTSNVLSVNVGNGTNAQSVKVYIDFNNDGNFSEDSEVVLNRSGVDPGAIVTASVLPPAGTVINVPLRMRVVGDYNGIVITSCSNPRYGEVEDYAVTFTDSSLGLALDNINKLTIVADNSNLIIKSESDISKITITDLSGKQIFTENNVNKKSFNKRFSLKNQIIIVSIVHKDGKKVSKQVRF